MRLVNTAAVARLTGLTTEQLREWSSRRALIPADVQKRGRGSPAQFAWQTILLLRLAAQLRDRFRVELGAHRGLFADMRSFLGEASFLRLRGSSIAIYDMAHWAVITVDERASIREAAILIDLDPHLDALAAENMLPSHAAAGQLELFPARLVPAASEGAASSAVERAPQKRPRRA
jgi:hypothetical protein